MFLMPWVRAKATREKPTTRKACRGYRLCAQLSECGRVALDLMRISVAFADCEGAATGPEGANREWPWVQPTEIGAQISLGPEGVGRSVNPFGVG